MMEDVLCVEGGGGRIIRHVVPHPAGRRIASRSRFARREPWSKVLTFP